MILPITRQFTGKPRIHRAYAFDSETARIIRGCDHHHRTIQAAENCGRKLVRQLTGARK